MPQPLLHHPLFYSPSQFLTHEQQDFLPSEFPFDFDDVAATNSTTELTRQLALDKPPRITTPNRAYQEGQYGNLGSPQSTLFQYSSSNDGSPNGQSQVSSPTSHFSPQTTSLDLINQAAAQVANLKINSKQPLNTPSAFYNSFVQRVREEQILKNEQQRRNGLIYQQQKQKQKQQNRFCGSNVGGYLENDESAWPSLQYMMHQNVKKGSGNGPVLQNCGSGNGYFNSVRKSTSVGTGVFLPRPYENSCVSTRTNKKTGSQMAQGQWQPRSRGLCSDDAVHLAQKNTMLIHQRRTESQQQVALGHELGLPHEWTY